MNYQQNNRHIPSNVILNGGFKPNFNNQNGQQNIPRPIKPMTKYNKNHARYKSPEYLNQQGFTFNNNTNQNQFNPYAQNQNNRNLANNYPTPPNNLIGESVKVQFNNKINELPGLQVPNNSPAESFISSQEPPRIPFLKQGIDQQFDNRGMSILPNKPFGKKIKPLKMKGGKKFKVEKPKPVEKHLRKGNPWEKVEEDEIKGELAEGKTILEISEKHQRSEKSIEKHIYKMAVAFLDKEPEKDKDELCAEYKINITKLKEILIKIEKASNKKVKAAAKHLLKKTEIERLNDSVKNLNVLIEKMTIEMNVFKDENNVMQKLIKDIHEKIMI